MSITGISLFIKEFKVVLLHTCINIHVLQTKQYDERLKKLYCKILQLSICIIIISQIKYKITHRHTYTWK